MPLVLNLERLHLRLFLYCGRLNRWTYLPWQQCPSQTKLKWFVARTYLQTEVKRAASTFSSKKASMFACVFVCRAKGWVERKQTINAALLWTFCSLWQAVASEDAKKRSTTPGFLLFGNLDDDFTVEPLGLVCFLGGEAPCDIVCCLFGCVWLRCETRGRSP